MSKRLIFFGTETFSAPSLELLIERGFDIAAVITKPDAKRGRGRHLEEPLVKKIAQQHSIAVLQPEKLADIESELSSIMPACGVLVAYGKIIPGRILDMFTPGIVNLHPSKLPRYRGPAPIEAAIKNGDTETAISIMKLTPGMDEGPIYTQQPVALDTENITRPQLYTDLSHRGAELLVDTLPAIISGELLPTEQSNDDVSYTTLLTKNDGIVDPLTDAAEEIERHVRAYLDFPKTHLTYNNSDVIITSSKVVDSPLDDELVIACKNDSYLSVESLIAPSGKSMSGSAYLRGLRSSS